MIILDTNLVSALMNDPVEEKVASWLNRQPQTSIWTTAVTILEINFGLKIMPMGKKRDGLIRLFDSILTEMGHRVCAFDADAAQLAADLMASRRTKGKVVDLRDTMIAGIVLARHATLATRNVAHFSDIPATVVNPWTA
ncbi:MAG TPA: PIN domain-containing protein [Candidatus Sulfotelmatobacter sp.]|nr:PIN domain-containing protein [Candidatus Sulfotelmatobacter sp.]